jgi:hypothetical protein
MDFVTVDVKGKVKELIKLLLRDEEVSDSTVDRAVRMLRQSDDGLTEHTGAIKQRIKQALLRNTVSGSNGPALVSAFEKECDTLRRMNSPLLQPFLAVMEPLSYSLVPVNEFGPKINTIKESDPVSSSSGAHLNTESSSPSMAPSDPSLPSMSFAIAGGLIPIVPPYHTSGVDINSSEAQAAWVSPETEVKLLKDLLYIFQVSYMHISLS